MTRATGQMTAAAVAIPTAAARSGSPAVLRRTFHVTWRTAAPATRTKTRGSTQRSYRRRARSPRRVRTGISRGGPKDAAHSHADAGHGERIEPERKRAEHRGDDVAAGDRRADPDSGDGQGDDHDDPAEEAASAQDHPAHPPERCREEHLEPTG